ncbi:MAG: hypothetical protein IAA31_02280 [Candidatus Anaerobiospirillum merdipullorum]|uniref:Uncharacterized protein n=1 Tax=Candidatus Anaerobiospirillum merdipullorum TaxID=2838450 RepID=A0A9E2KMQ9_9GAMM|nr:hypothetical protein [Candidatus Anaerobiospirillum merdipullorum]
MQATEAIKTVFQEAGWTLMAEESNALLDCFLELDKFTARFCTYNEDELFLSAKLMNLPENEDERFELLKSAAALCAYLWQRHKINLTVTENSLTLELMVNTASEDFREKIRVFLDDGDYFIENLEAMKTPVTGPSLSAFF